MPQIVQWLIPASNKKTRPGIKRTPMSITIHETGNTNVGANAKSHARLQELGNSREASWQYQVDDGDIIYQSVPDDEVAWAAGDGRGPGNMYSIHIEICVNKDGNYKKAVENAAWLVRYLLSKHPHLTINVVYQHNKWSGKNCPQQMRSGKAAYNWGQFLTLARTPQASSVVRYPAHVLGIATVTTDFLNMRKAPSTNAAVIGKAEKGTSWRVLEIKDGWYRIGPSAWISNADNAYATYTINSNPLPEEKKEAAKMPERDINKVSDWAKTSWEKAHKKKGQDGSPIMDGTRPGAVPTREEIAVILDRAGLLD